MFEKVNPMHPDKIADRIAGALVDYAYKKDDNPKIAVEVLIGHGECHIITETSVKIPKTFVDKTVKRVAQLDDIRIDYKEVAQDSHLASNQDGVIRCGDNGIFKGMPVSYEEFYLTSLVQDIYDKYPTDGKYIIRYDEGPTCMELVACQSNADKDLESFITSRMNSEDKIYALNPLGDWTGGVNVDSGATNRKLGSDMGRAATGGGLHGKDLSKADVTLNIYAHLLAQVNNAPVELTCAIGDEKVNGIDYGTLVDIARNYIKNVGGFEKFAEWGLIHVERRNDNGNN